MNGHTGFSAAFEQLIDKLDDALEAMQSHAHALSAGTLQKLLPATPRRLNQTVRAPELLVESVCRIWKES